MIKKIIIGPILFAFLFVKGFAQEPVSVTEQTIKIGAGKEEEIYFGFAKGDKIVFNFSEINGKELKEIEVVEYPSSSKFSDFKTSKIDTKTIAVGKQSIYVFRFKNSSLGARICKINIQRIAANETSLNFNTSVEWVTKQDTTWNVFTKDVVIGYDTVYEQKVKKELIKTTQREELIMDKVERVHSTTNGNGNKTALFFTLPSNTQQGNLTKQVTSWAFWIGVGEEANAAWKQNTQAIKSLVKTGASLFTTPLGALAIGLVTDLATPKLGEDVAYAIVDKQNKDLFLSGLQYRGWDYGKGVAGYKKFSDPSLCRGTYFICLTNDNSFQGIDATVKVIAIMETKEFADKQYTEMIVTPKNEKQLFREPIVKTYKMPITGQ